MKFTHKVVAKVYDEDGKLVDERIGTNTVLSGDPTTDASQEYNGYVMTLQRLLDDDDSGAIVSDETAALVQMQLGSGTPDNEGLGTPDNVTAPTEDTTEGFDTVVWDYVSSTTSIDVVLSTGWDSAYPAMTGVTEVAILNFNNEPFASKTFSPALSKTTGGTLTVEWTLTVGSAP